MSDFVTLRRGGCAAIFDLRDAAPSLLHFGASVRGDPAALAAALDWPTVQAGLDRVSAASVIPEASQGFPGRPGLEGRRHDGSSWAPRMERTETVVDDAHAFEVTARDDQAGLDQRIEAELLDGPVLRVRATVTNTASVSFDLDALMLTMLLPSWATEVMQLGGRWANEFRPERRDFHSGHVEIENRTGRTSHDRFPALFVGTDGFGEQHGRVWGAHLAWSGNSSMRAEVLADGRRVLQAGELLLPGEIVLEPQQSYTSPWLYLAASANGLNDMSAAFHQHLRSRSGHPSTARPVLLNTWEAVYFNHDLATLLGLADRAAEIGVERFVLDDGWFRHRRSDEAGLGDWFVDDDVWPDGLHPLVDHVRGLGLEFGLWFEPEMVNPDSDLYREHPDWVLHAPHQQPIQFRNQLVLDLVNPAVFDYLFERIDAVLSEYDIGYIKWDMNRNLVAPSHDGRATVHHQTHAFYRLVDAVAAAHPAIEIESCSSGGGRADFAVLERTKRIWTSDCNDALDRQRIQRGFSYLFPPEIMGAHIGPPESHTTSRVHSRGFRAASAFFGHLGLEWNVLQASPDELTELAQIIEAHKRFRPLLHSGRVVRLDVPDPSAICHMVVDTDGSEAMLCVAQIATSDAPAIGSVAIPGLNPERTFQIERVELGSQPPGRAKKQPSWLTDGVALTGSQLAVGLQIPVMNPESAIVLHVTAK